MNKILIDFNIKNFRIFYANVSKKIKLIRKDKVKEFVKSLQEELVEMKKSVNEKDITLKVEEFKKKYFMINETSNILEYDFFNDEIIHHKMINFLNEEKNLDKIGLTHEIEVMESILTCYYEKCSLNIDYSDMTLKKNENDEMKKIVKHYETKFNHLKNKIQNNEDVLNEGIGLIDELKCLLILASKISARTSTILFGHVLINNISRAFLKTLYDEKVDYLECENKFFLTNVKESEYFKNILKDSIENWENIIIKFKEEFNNYLEKFPEFSSIKEHLGKCIEELEGGA